ncbi:MAG: hypothetical protein WC052_04205 [Patescibacteria group bacterium]
MQSHKEDASVDLSKAGTGSHFQSGRFGDARHKGLAGQLRRFKWSGGAVRREAKNLSKKDLSTIANIIGDELKRLPTGATSISYFARRRMQKAGWKAQRAGVISSSDRKDLKKIVNALSAEHVPELHRLVRQHESTATPTARAAPVELHNAPLTRLPVESVTESDDEKYPDEETEIEERAAPHILPQLAPPPRRQKDPSAMDIG